MNLRRFILISALASTFTCSHAQQISVSKAKENAQSFIKSVDKNNSSTNLQLAYTGKQDGEVHYYVFNKPYDGGFVIVAGDESATQILGYTTQGTFDYNDAPDNLKWLLSLYDTGVHTQIMNAKTRGVAESRERKASRIYAEIPALLTTQWGQDYPYNMAIPKVKSTELVTGCLPLAMSQIMTKWEYPKQGVGSKSYTINYDLGAEKVPVTFSADFANTTYDFDLINSVDGGTAADKEIAKLIYHVGVAMDTKYSSSASGGSGAYDFDAATAIINHFDYDKGMRSEVRDFYSDSEWEELLYRELAQGRPIIYSGTSTLGGHSFVCHGYRNGLFAINWGWFGNYNGYFALTGNNILNPSNGDSNNSHSAAAKASYSEGQRVLIGIQPNAGNDYVSHIVTHAKNSFYVVGSNEYDKQKESDKIFKVVASFVNMGFVKEGICIGVKATGVNTGKVVYFINETNVELDKNKYIVPTLSVPSNKFPYNDKYELSLVYRNSTSTSDEDCKEVQLYNGADVPYIIIKGIEDQDINFNVESNQIELGSTMQIKYNKDYNGYAFYESSDNTIATVDNAGLIKTHKIGNVKITASGSAADGYKATKTVFDISVVNKIKKTPTISLSRASISPGGTATIVISEKGFDGTVSVTGYNKDIISFENGTITGKALGSTTLTVKTTDTEHYVATSKTFTIYVVGNGFEFVETPYFDNDNNPFIDGRILHVDFRNAGSIALECALYVAVTGKTEGGTFYFSSYFKTSSAVPSDYNLTYDYDVFGSFSSYMVSGIKYTIEFFLDEEHSTPANIKSLDFVWCDKKTIDYSLPDTQWGTLCLPFDAEIPEDMTVYECADYTGRDLNLTAVGKIKRATPYIIHGKAGDYSFSGPDAAVANSTMGKGLLVGVLSDDVLLEKNDFVLQHNNGVSGFYIISDDLANKYYATKYRAILRVENANYKMFNIFDGVDLSTGIKNISTSAQGLNGASVIYGIDGTVRSGYSKGINIIRTNEGTVKKIVK